jgi:hypothetical protein
MNYEVSHTVCTMLFFAACGMLYNVVKTKLLCVTTHLLIRQAEALRWFSLGERYLLTGLFRKGRDRYDTTRATPDIDGSDLKK